MVGLLVFVALVVLVGWAIYKWNHQEVLISCNWCSKNVIVWRKTARGYLNHPELKFYCSGRCQRADEASEGVKEKRFRIIDHE